ncbi:4-alpha-glucanotransferase [Acidicapsa ligni]|uniref:4-alpha-glucanotransferase n=1 Tax=Acidicapsa ligni TaxID=542300 RepID=UPI0021E02745|nr:4-alpha-glucanotransferase [Acidicapsa ligni]
MEFQRSSGILLHISSLASYGGIGDMGPEAYKFLDFLHAGKQHIWQVLPLCPTGYGNSPYAGSSAFAGNPSLISLELLSDWGWIAGDRIANLAGRNGNVNFEDVENRKRPLLYEAAKNFLELGPKEERFQSQWQRFTAFCTQEASWLNDYAYYAVLRREFKTGAWTAWPEPLRRREPAAMEQAAAQYGNELAVEQALQFAFEEQWTSLRSAAAKQKIRFLGDIAIFVSMDSADVWANPGLFQLDEDLNPIRVAGVPPDYFSPTGQRWGNPLYRWDVLAETGYGWWVQRIRRSCNQYDIVRLDHFRGFEAYWSIPANEETAINGEWIKAPGADLFDRLEHVLGPLPLVAEDLGLITPEVDALRINCSMPGMRVLQFGFSSVEAHNHLPHRFVPATVSYTGTHDNDTTLGWWQHATDVERAALETYLGPVAMTPVWALMRASSTSVAELAIVPAQDLLALGSEARMNTPAIASGNWSWRAPEDCWTEDISRGLADLVDVSDRDNDPLKSSATTRGQDKAMIQSL